MPALTLTGLRKFRPQIEEAAKRCGISGIRVFGSVARGDADENSDIDLLVEVEKERSLFEIVDFKLAVEFLLKRPVDVVEEAAIRTPLRRKYIIEDAVPL